MTEMPYDSPRRAPTIDKAKEARRYDQATEAAIEKIRSLLGGDVNELDGHPLADIYVQELVRCETVRLMQDGSLYDARQIEEYLRTLIESGDHIFLLYYDGAILSYGRDGMRHSLRRAAEVLAQRLEHCFAPA